MRRTLLKVLVPLLGLGILGGLLVQMRRVGGKEPPGAPGGPAGRARPGAETRVLAEGRIITYPGGEVAISTDLGGTLTRMRVRERDAVKKGDVLCELLSDEPRAALAEARAHVAEAEADLAFLEGEVGRHERLLASNAEASQALDRARHDRDAARARHELAAASVRRLGAVVRKTRILAPIDGVVVSRRAEPGETVAAGAHLLTIADLGRLRVEAEVDEFDVGRVRVGASAVIHAEGYDARWRGAVEEIPDAVVGRHLKPQDPGRPIDTRVLLVKISLTQPTPLKLGQRVEIEIGVPPASSGPRS